MYLLLAFVLVLYLSCVRFADSGAFMVWVPIGYYLYRRIATQLISPRVRWVLICLGCVAIILLLLPLTRRSFSARHCELASKAIGYNHVVEAQRHLARAAQWDSNHPELLYLKYQIADAASETDDAREFLAQAVAEGHNDIDSLYTLARLYAQAGMTEQEIPIYHQILERRPRHPEANYCLAMYYDLHERNREKAIHHLQIARDNLPYENEWRKRCEEILVRLENDQ